MATYEMGERKNSAMVAKMEAVIYGDVSDARSIRCDLMKANYILDRARGACSPDHFDTVLLHALEQRVARMEDNLLRDIAQEWILMLQNHDGAIYDTRGIAKNTHC